MARRKVRYYPTTEDVANIINNYFKEHREEVIEDMIAKVNRSYNKSFNTLDELHQFDVYGSYYGGFGLDCGWVRVKTMNKEQLREWTLDNGKWDALVWGISCPYNTQSTTLQEIMVNKALQDLGMTDTYYASVRLD